MVKGFKINALPNYDRVAVAALTKLARLRVEHARHNYKLKQDKLSLHDLIKQGKAIVDTSVDKGSSEEDKAYHVLNSAGALSNSAKVHCPLKGLGAITG